MISEKEENELFIKGLESQLESLEKLYQLEEWKEKLIDANCNLLERIIAYCEKNSVPFDQGLRGTSA